MRKVTVPLPGSFVPTRKLLAIVLVAIALASGNTAAAEGRAHLVGPKWGVVDFADRVAFRLTGAGCAGTEVAVRVTAGPAGKVVRGKPAKAVRDPLDPSECVGAVTVPSDPEVRKTGWLQGDPIRIDMVSSAGTVPLRFQRFEADHAKVAAGNPTVVAAGDAYTPRRDRAVSMTTGDALDLGRVNLEHIDSIAVRLCKFPDSAGVSGRDVFVPARPPAAISLRADSPSGEAYVGPYDVSGPASFTRGDAGWKGCYELTNLPLDNQRRERSPRLFLVADAVAPGTLVVNSIDFNGTGARLPIPRPKDLPGMKVLFDGRSFKGWSVTDCRIRDGAATWDESRPPHTRGIESGKPLEFWGCMMEYKKKLHNVVIRLRLRRANFFDNGGIFLGSHEIQLRSAGEYLPGGYLGEYAANWQKLNSWPAWTEMEIIQLGARHVVRVNGRTVTDHIASIGDPEPFKLMLATQPFWSMRFGLSHGLGDETPPEVDGPQDWGNFWFADVRAYPCTSVQDPVCVREINALPGQAARW